MFKTAGKAS